MCWILMALAVAVLGVAPLLACKQWGASGFAGAILSIACWISFYATTPLSSTPFRSSYVLYLGQKHIIPAILACLMARATLR